MKKIVILLAVVLLVAIFFSNCNFSASKKAKEKYDLKVIKRLEIDTVSAFWYLAWSRNSDYLSYMGLSKTDSYIIYLWNLKSGKNRKITSGRSPSFYKDNQFYYIYKDRVFIYNLNNPHERKQFRGLKAIAVEVSPNNKYLFLQKGNDGPYIYNIKNRELKPFNPPLNGKSDETWVGNARWSGNENRIIYEVVESLGDSEMDAVSTFWQIDIDTGDNNLVWDESEKYAPEYVPIMPAISPDGKYMAYEEPGKLVISRLKDDLKVAEKKLDLGSVNFIDWSYDGKKIALELIDEKKKAWIEIYSFDKKTIQR